MDDDHIAEDNIPAAETFIDSLTDNDAATDALQKLKALFDEVKAQ